MENRGEYITDKEVFFMEGMQKDGKGIANGTNSVRKANGLRLSFCGAKYARLSLKRNK